MPLTGWEDKAGMKEGIIGRAECYGGLLLAMARTAIKEIYTRETSIQLNPEESEKPLATRIDEGAAKVSYGMVIRGVDA